MNEQTARTALELHPDRLFPVDDASRNIARSLYSEIKDLPLLSPHGHTDPAWFAQNNCFSDATDLLLKPDHYLFRMLYSKGIGLEALGISTLDGTSPASSNFEAWCTFASHYYLFRGTASALWLDHVFSNIFEMDVVLNKHTAEEYFERINSLLQNESFRPRSLFDRFNIEVLATTESPTDSLLHHLAIRESDWDGKVITAFRPDPVVDPEFEGFSGNLDKLEELTGEDTGHWQGYLEALRNRRNFFREMGATSTDHGHPTAATADLGESTCQSLLSKAKAGTISPAEAESFRAQMLTEMAAMSLDDGLVMQLHPGAFRNHNAQVLEHYGRDMGADIPMRTDYVSDLKPLLDRFGNNADLTLILFTLDESSYSRELAPLAGHYPCLRIGPSWWFHDSPEGMNRFRRHIIETAGFYNTVGFVDDTRAFMSIPARHDVARRMDCRFLAELVAEHRLGEDEALDLAHSLAYGLCKEAFKL